MEENIRVMDADQILKTLIYGYLILFGVSALLLADGILVRDPFILQVGNCVLLVSLTIFIFLFNFLYSQITSESQDLQIKELDEIRGQLRTLNEQTKEILQTIKTLHGQPKDRDEK